MHILTSFGVGGTERQFLELARGLDRRRWRPSVVCFRKTGALLDEAIAMGLDPRVLPLSGSLLRAQTALAVARLARWITDEGAAVVHCHDIYAVLIGVPAARLAGVPVLAARRDLGHHITSIQRPMLRLALAQATKVLANAATVASQAEREDGVPAARLALVPNGLDLATFDRRAQELEASAPLADGGPPTILTVARMTYPAKGHGDLLEAIPKVRAAVGPVRFALAGDGPYEEPLRREAVKLGIADCVHFLGRRGDVPALLARTDLVCHPARMEGLPNAVMEAMAASRPIVATAVGGTPELIQDGVHGVLVPPQDPDRLARALIDLLRDAPRRERMARAARERVETCYSLAQLIERMDRLYGEMAGASPYGTLSAVNSR